MTPSPIGSTLSGVDEPVIDVREHLKELTFNEIVGEAIDRAKALRESARGGDEGRDLSIAITHLEDALTRYNSSRYRRFGMWKRADPDRTLA